MTGEHLKAPKHVRRLDPVSALAGRSPGRTLRRVLQGINGPSSGAPGIIALSRVPGTDFPIGRADAGLTGVDRNVAPRFGRVLWLSRAAAFGLITEPLRFRRHKFASAVINDEQSGLTRPPVRI